MLCFSIVTLVGAIRMLEPETILVRACVASLMVAIVVRLARGLTLIGLPQGVRRG